MIRQLQREQVISGDPAKIWNFFATPKNLNELTPPSVRFQFVGELAEYMYAGQLIEYRISVVPGLWMKWLTEITHVREGSYFVDEQRVGPYRLWHHEHHFTPVAGGLRMIDRVTYDVGWGPLGALMERCWVRSQLARIFDYRAERVRQLFPS